MAIHIPEFTTNELPELNEADTERLVNKLTEAISNQLNHDIHKLSDMAVTAGESLYELRFSLNAETLIELVTQEESRSLNPNYTPENNPNKI